MLKKAVVALFAFAVLFMTSASYAQTKPADSMIKAVVGDLDRYEKQAEGLTPKHKSNIIRIDRMLPMTEQRLARSKNKSHPSWIEASDRLKALKERLAALKSGKTPTAAKPAVAPAAAPGGMTDNQIAAKYNNDYKAVSNEIRGTHISKFADPGVVDGFKAKLEELKKLVGSIQSPNNRKSFTAHYRSIEANFDKKVAHAQSQAARQSASQPQAAKPRQQRAQPAPQPQAAAKPSGPLDYQNKRNLGFFKKDYNRYAKEFNQITPANTPKLTGYIDRLENRLSKLTAKDHPDVVNAQQKVAALKAKLGGAQQSQPSQAAIQSDTKTHKEFQKLYNNNRVALDFLDPAELSKPAEAKRWKKILGQLETIVAKFQDKNNDQVNKDLGLFAKAKTKIESGLGASVKMDINNYPDIDKDQEFLNALYDKYSATKIFAKGNEAKAKSLIGDYDKDKAAYDQLDKTYATFIEGNQAASAPAYKRAGDLKRSFRNAGQWIDKFANARADFVANAGPKIEGLLAKAQQMVDQAINEKRPEWFTGGGIQHAMIQASSGIDSLASIKGENDSQVKGLRAKYTALNTKINKAEVSLKDSILAATPMPADAFTGGDKNQVIDLAVKEWNKKHADKKLLAQGISMPNWERKTEWRYKVDNTRYKVDRSYLQVWVIIQTSDTIATQYFIELSKNHIQNNTITLNAPSNLQGDVFKTEMLLKNVK
jgi:hypothetical protein